MNTKTIRRAALLLSTATAVLLAGTAQARTDKTDVFTFMNPDGSPAAGNVVGQARLKRSANGVRVEIDTSSLAPGAAYSIWWIVFNNPDACGAECTDADFFTPEVEASVLNATGRVADSDGNAVFTAFLPVGFIHTNPASNNVRHAFGPGLQEPARAEIHLVVRSHGPATGNPEQISTLFADCLADDGMGGMVCFDAQAVVFAAP